MTPTVGMRLQMRAVTKRGKQLLQEFNTVWRVVQIADDVLFSKREGPWLLIEPLMEDSSKRLIGGRWIHGRLDDHLAITREV